MKKLVLYCFCALMIDAELIFASECSFISSFDRVQDLEITPNYGTQNKQRPGVGIEITYIYWRVSEDGLSTGAQSINLPPSISNKVVTSGEGCSILDRASSGFKVGLGSDFNYDGWKVDLVYTYYHSNNNPEIFEKEGCQEIPSQNGPYYATSQGNFPIKYQGIPVVTPLLFNNIIDEAFAYFRMRFNVLDITLSKSFYVSPKLICTPKIGFKGTWQKQDWIQKMTCHGNAMNISGLSKSPTFSLLNPTFSAEDESYQNVKGIYKIDNIQWYGGVGPRFGFESSWTVIDEIALFVDLSGSTLFGYFKNNRADQASIQNSINELILDDYAPIKSQARHHALSAVLESLIGIRYDAYFSNEKYRFRMQFGYENQLWFNQSHFIGNFLQKGQGGDLGFMGVNFTVRGDF